MLEFSLPMKAFSVNKMSYRDARFKTQEFKDWFTELIQRLQEIKELSAMGDDWRKNGGYFEIWIEIVYPPHVYYNKSGQVSSKTFDVTNTEKPIVDAIFREVMCVDDRNLIRCTGSKRAGATHSIEIKLKLDAKNGT